MMPDLTKPFQIETDASKYATGAVLTQLDANGDRHPVSFISKTLSPAERNYEIYDRELLAIIRSLEEWRHYIQGSPHTTIVLSDHKNLTYYREAKKLTRRQARWSLYLSLENSRCQTSKFDTHPPRKQNQVQSPYPCWRVRVLEGKGQGRSDDSIPYAKWYQTFVLMKITTMKTSSCSRTTCFLTSSISSYKRKSHSLTTSTKKQQKPLNSF
jgi:hypothetical protein